MSYWYLASPYSNYKAGLDAAHRDVCIEAARLIRAGVSVFSPIAHGHPIALHGGVNPRDLDFWLPADKPMMDAADGLIVLMLEGWLLSRGLMHEIDAFCGDRKPIIYMRPGEIGDVLKRPAVSDRLSAERRARPREVQLEYETGYMERE